MIASYMYKNSLIGGSSLADSKPSMANRTDQVARLEIPVILVGVFALELERLYRREIAQSDA